jgi:hypothetical protein
MMKTKLLPLLLLSAAGLSAQVLPATFIARSAGDAESGLYRNGFTAPGKCMTGGAEGNLWKGFVIFDVISEVEALAQRPKGSLELAFDWIKSPDDVNEAKVYYVAAVPSIEARDDTFRGLYHAKGTEIGTVPVYSLAGLRSRTPFTFDLEGKIPSGDVTPVNRYLVFRIESDYPDNPEANGLIGLAPDVNAHKLTVGDAAAGDAVDTGGY